MISTKLGEIELTSLLQLPSSPLRSVLRTRRLNSPRHTLLQQRFKIFACIYLIFVIFDICLASLLRYPLRPVIFY